jgi:hypothetical protein
VADAGEVERHAVPGPDRGDRGPEGLDAADARGAGTRFDDDRVVDGERTVGERAGDHGAAALGGEGAVDPQPGAPTIGRRWGPGEQLVERGSQLVEPAAGRRRDRDDRCTVEERAGDAIGDVEHRDLAPLIVDEVDLRQSDQAVADAEHLEDAEVLLGLRLPALRRGDDEQADVDGADPSEHVAQEPDVPRNVDEADPRPGRQDGVREPEVDRESAPLLLLEPVRVGPRQRQHQRRLPVVHVPRRRDHRRTPEVVAHSGHARIRCSAPCRSAPCRSAPCRSAPCRSAHVAALSGRLTRTLARLCAAPA